MDVLRCDLELLADGYAIGVVMGDELPVSERQPDERRARERAAELRQRYLAWGWCAID